MDLTCFEKRMSIVESARVLNLMSNLFATRL